MDSPSSGAEFCVLSVVIHQRYCGHVAITRWGLVARSFGICKLQHLPSPAEKVTRLARALKDGIHRFRPTCVVLGRKGTPSSTTAHLFHAARAILRAAQVPWTEERCAVGHRLLTNRSRGHRPEQLGETIVGAFFPELAARLTADSRRSSPTTRHEVRDRARWRYHANAWYATALALRELTRHHPRSAFALARRDAGTFGEEIARAERRLHPTI